MNVYSDELTTKLEIVEKKTEAGEFVGVRFYIETPVTLKNNYGAKQIVRGPFEKVDGDDDSSAVTLWAKAGSPDILLKLLRKAAAALAQVVQVPIPPTG